ncbi:MAG: MFS transporter [Thermoleophilaceae bacterium]|nr:MFS transporter [Thermoleophilaceae bacterium]
MSASTSSASTSPDAGLHWDARLWGALVVLCGVLFLDGLDVSMVGVALPSIGSDLDLSTSSLQWVVSGYVLGYGGLLLLGGRFADLLGRRRVLLSALAVFTVASILGGMVDDGTLLIATRFFKGAAAAFTAPASLSIITTTFEEGPARNRALSIYTACGASGFSLGLVFGGLMTELGWRWSFLLPVPVAIALLIVAPRVLPKDAPIAGVRRRFDLAGAVTLTAGMLLLVRTVVEAPDAGWDDPATPGGLILSALLLAAFVAIERRSAHPLVRLGILRSAPLVRANLGMASVFGAYVGFQFVGTLYLQSLLGWSPLETALAFLPGGLIVAFGSPRLGPLVDRFGTGRLILVGSLAFVVGYGLFLRIGDSFSYVGLFLPTMLLIGIGFALCFPALNMQATAGVADHEQGLASGLVNTSFQVGGALGLAIVTAVVSANTGTATDAASMLDGFRPAIAVVTGVAALGVAVALAGSPRFSRVGRLEPAVVEPGTEAVPEGLPEEVAGREAA